MASSRSVANALRKLQSRLNGGRVVTDTLQLNERPYLESLKRAKLATEQWKKQLEGMRVNLPAGMGPGGGSGSSSAAGRWADLGGKIQAASLAMRGLQMAGNAVKSLFNSEASFENLIRGLAATSDGSETLREELTSLQETAKLPGLGFRESVQGAAALKQAGLNAKEARDAMEAFGNALANAGRGKADLDAVLQSLQQMASQGNIDEGNIKEIARRIPGFRQMTAGLDKEGKPLDFIKGAVIELRKMPKAAESAQDAIDNLKDAVDLKRLGLTGGKVAGVGGTIASQIGSFVTGNGFSAGEIFDSIKEGDVISKYQPGDEEIKRRQQARKEAEAAMKDASEAAASKLFGQTQKELEIQNDMARAREKGDAAGVAALEEKLMLLKNVSKLAKDMGVSEEFVTEKLQSRLEAEREIERIEARTIAAREKNTADIAALRSRGRDKAANKLEEKATKDARVQELLTRNPEMRRADAEAIADRDARTAKDAAFRQRTGRNRLHGGISRNTVSGLDEFPFQRDSALLPETPVLSSDPFRQRRMRPPQTPAAGEARPREPHAPVAGKGKDGAGPELGALLKAVQNTGEMVKELRDLKQLFRAPVGEKLKPVN